MLLTYRVWGLGLEQLSQHGFGERLQAWLILSARIRRLTCFDPSRGERERRIVSLHLGVHDRGGSILKPGISSNDRIEHPPSTPGNQQIVPIRDLTCSGNPFNIKVGGDFFGAGYESLQPSGHPEIQRQERPSRGLGFYREGLGAV